MNKDVLLVYPTPDKTKSYRFGYSMLLLYIAADLQAHGYNVSLWDFSVKKYPDQSFNRLLNSALAVIMEIDAFPLKRSTNFDNARVIANDIRTINPDIPIIAVGKQCTLFDKSLDFVNATISGDSEIQVREVLDSIKLGNCIKPFYDAGYLTDLSVLPMPAYNLLGKDQIHGKTSSGHMHLAASALLETSRGCPGKCTFCQRKGWSEKVSLLPPEKVRQTFRYLIQHDIRNIWVTDENFAGNLKHAIEMLHIFTEENHDQQTKICISSWVNINNDFLRYAKSAGISIISFGIESISSTNQAFYNKFFDAQKVKDMLEYADSIGLYTIGNFIVGSPYDTETTVEETIKFAIESKLDVINVKTLDYMMGSELYDRLPPEQQKGIHFFACQEMGVTNLSRAEIQEIVKRFSAAFQKSREISLPKKIAKYGPPYWSL